MVSKPFLAQDLFDDGVVDQCIHYAIKASSGLKTNLYARFLVVFLNGLAHDVSRLGSSCRFELSCGGFDIVGTAIHGQYGGRLDVLRRLQASRFQNDLHLLIAASVFHLPYFVADGLVVAAEESTHGEHHINLCGAVFYGE